MICSKCTALRAWTVYATPHSQSSPIRLLTSPVGGPLFPAISAISAPRFPIGARLCAGSTQQSIILHLSIPAHLSIQAQYTARLILPCCLPEEGLCRRSLIASTSNPLYYLLNRIKDLAHLTLLDLKISNANRNSHLI